MEQPSSPGTGKVDLRDCIDQLLKFVLESHIDETLELDLGLSRDYCCNLLREHSRDQGEGVPPSPSYKRLALVLHELITCTKLCGTNRAAWREMLAGKGSELLDVFKAINFELHVQEPFFTQLKDGLKTIEGRCATGNYKRFINSQRHASKPIIKIQPPKQWIAAGALILFNKCLVLEVEEVHSYNSFSEMLVAEGLQNVLPGVKTTEEGASVYRNFYTEEKERSNGVVAICVTKPASSQPYNILASMISKLSYSGIEGILSNNTSHDRPG